MPAVLIQLERQNGHPEFGRAIPYVTLRLNTTARSMHHACVRRLINKRAASEDAAKFNEETVAKSGSTLQCH